MASQVVERRGGYRDVRQCGCGESIVVEGPFARFISFRSGGVVFRMPVSIRPGKCSDEGDCCRSNRMARWTDEGSHDGALQSIQSIPSHAALPRFHVFSPAHSHPHDGRGAHGNGRFWVLGG